MPPNRPYHSLLLSRSCVGAANESRQENLKDVPAQLTPQPGSSVLTSLSSSFKKLSCTQQRGHRSNLVKPASQQEVSTKNATDSRKSKDGTADLLLLQSGHGGHIQRLETEASQVCSVPGDSPIAHCDVWHDLLCAGK